MQITWEVIRK